MEWMFASVQWYLLAFGMNGSPVRPSTGCLLPPSATFFKLFGLPQPSVTLAFAQFVTSVRGLPSLFSTVFNNEEKIGNGD
jgi:hypothetical protein